jgi:ABC-2 type transport system ATP-binding protein
MVRELAATGTAILLSSHQISEVEEVCDSFTVLRRGRVMWEGTTSELRAQAPASAHRLQTSDDRRALEISERQAGVQASVFERGGLALTAEGDSLDRYVLALGSAGVAVRRLELLLSPLESMFLALTSDTQIEPSDPRRLAELAETELAEA